MNNVERAEEIIRRSMTPQIIRLAEAVTITHRTDIEVVRLVEAVKAHGEGAAKLFAAAPALVDALVSEKQARQKLRAEMSELVEYLSIQEGNDRPSRLYVHGQHSAMELIKDILEDE